MGGNASAEAGADLVARLEDTTAVGVGDVARRALDIARARGRSEEQSAHGGPGQPFS